MSHQLLGCQRRNVKRIQDTLCLRGKEVIQLPHALPGHNRLLTGLWVDEFNCFIVYPLDPGYTLILGTWRNLNAFSELQTKETERSSTSVSHRPFFYDVEAGSRLST